jgi:uncharacterized membrane protein
MTSLVAIIVGAVLGGVWKGEFGALIGALIGWLLARSFRLEQQIAGLRHAIDALQTARSLEPQATKPVAAAPVAAAPVIAPPVTAAPPSFVDTVPGAPPPRVTTPPPPPPAPDALAPVKRWLFGGNTIVKTGIGILFIGLAFLAKYATEHVQVPVELRLAAIGGAALVLLVLGWRLRWSRPGYAQVLQGGAVAVLYLTLFVAFRFYSVLAVGPVFALMVAVAALAAALAVLQDARSLAVIGALGGFATPLLVSTGSGNHVALFSYYLVLDLGIAAVAWHRTWRALNLIGFAGTFLVGTAWGVLKYRPENYASGQGFLIAYFLLFIAIMLMPARHRDDAAPRADAWVNGSLLFGLPTISFALQYGLVRHTEYGTAISALVLAAFYVLLATGMRSRPRLALTFDASLAIGTVFLTLVIPFALDARSTAGAWALEGAGLVWLGLRQSRGIARAFGYALLFLAGVSMLIGHQHVGMPASVFNATLFNALMAAAASLAAAFFVRRHARVAPAEAIAEPLLIGWATLWLLSAAAVQIDAFVLARFTLAAWIVSLSAIALGYTALAQRFDWRAIAWPVIAHAPLMALGVAASAALFASPLQGGGWWAWTIALATHAVVLWRTAPRWSEGARHAVHAIGVLVVAAWGALEGRAITADWGDAASAWPWLGWLVVPAALLIALPRPGAAQRWPVRAAPLAYQATAAGVLAAGLLLWTLLANIASDGSARPLPHVPLVNPLDLGIGVALLAAARWTRSDAARSLLRANPGLPLALLSVAGFVWLNAILVRGFHHYDSVPYRLDAWLRSAAVQTGLTLLWTVTALVLMWFAARRAARLPWTVGAALLGAVVLKLLLVDLAGTGTVTRIVSFIGVGVLMLVIGYVAPLPAKEEHHAAS